MLTKKYWLEIKSDRFKVDLFRVIPSFETDEAWAANKTAIGKASAPDAINLGKHLTLIKEIAKGEKENTLLPDTDLSNLSEDQILRVFVKHDQSSSQASAKSEKAEKKKKLKAVFGQFGTELSSRKRFTNERTYARIEASLERDEEEGVEEMD